MDKRLIYRVVLKILFFLSLVLLSIILINSLFTQYDNKSNQEKSISIVQLDISGMMIGEIRKTHWQGKQVGTIRLKDNNYFTFVNVGDSGNCPLFKEVNGLKDICTGTHFDFMGRQRGRENQGVKLRIPPSYREKNILFIGVNKKLLN